LYLVFATPQEKWYSRVSRQIYQIGFSRPISNRPIDHLKFKFGPIDHLAQIFSLLTFQGTGIDALADGVANKNFENSF